MKHQRDFKRVSDVALREAAQVSALISDLDRAVRIINQDIAAEEERARVSERTAGHAPDLFERGWTLNDTENPNELDGSSSYRCCCARGRTVRSRRA